MKPQLLRVLIIEDSEDDTLLVVRELRNGGYDVVYERVETSEALMRALGAREWDVIVSDYTMPQFSGATALQIIRERDALLPFIFMSGTIGEEAAVAAMRNGATDYLLKDRPGRLCQAVSQALAQRRLRELHEEAQRELQENQRRIRLILDTANDAFVVMDANGRITDWNVRAETLFGWKRDEVIGRVLAETVIPPPFREAHNRGLAHYLATGEGPILNQGVELTALDRDGREFPVELIVWPIRLGATLTFSAFVRDISGRKETEAALRQSEERYRLLFENNPQPMWAYDVESLAFLAVNEAAVAHYGYRREEFMRMTIKDIRPSDETPSLMEHLAGLTAPVGQTGVWRHRKKNGSIIDVEIASHELELGGRRARLVLAIDVTERRRAEVARQRLIDILEATPDLVAISHVDGPASYINAAGRALLGIGTNKAVFLSDYRTEDAKHIIAEEAIPAAIRDGVWSGETELRSAAGEIIPISQVLIAHKLSSGAIEFLSTIARDIRPQKKLEAQFRHAQKMEAVGRLAGGIAHDFNNLLTVINGFAELAMLSLRPVDPLYSQLTEIRGSGERAAALTRQLLAFSRKQLLVPVVINLNALVVDMEKMLRRMIGEDIDLVFHPDPKLWPVRADAGQMEQVVMNLVVNARDAMPKGGKATIETANVTLDTAYVGLHPDSRPGDYVQLAVTDTGVGMDPATRSQVFEPFFTTKGEKGTGLGLSTVYGIVKQSGGQIEVYSELGVGTTFKIYLPRDREGVPSRRSSILSVPAGGSETILLVEDEAAVRTLTRTVLSLAGYQVLAAEHGGDALLICEQHQGPIHLLITDVVMPAMGGRELAERLRLLRPDIKILYVSGYADDAIVRHGVLEANVPFLQKPFTPASLTRKVRAVLDQAPPPASPAI